MVRSTLSARCEDKFFQVGRSQFLFTSRRAYVVPGYAKCSGDLTWKMRWLPYSCVGSVIKGTRLICFKVPLRKNVLEHQNLRTDEIWDLETLLKSVPKLKYVIDLTNTNRYYDPRVLEAAGVEHVKIAMPGRVIPPENTVKLFSDTVERFIRRSDDGLIGVHCTHGLNRTGYMVCRYLRDKMGIPAATAIEIFEDARGYKIERDNYLADLQGAEPPPPDFGQDTILKVVEKQDNNREHRSPQNRTSSRSREYQHRSGGNSGRQGADRASRYGKSGWRERDRTRSRSRERSPVRTERRQEHHERDRKQINRNDKTRENGYKQGRRDGRFRRYSNESGHSNSSDYDFRYDY